MRELHNPRKRTQCPDQTQAPKEQHPHSPRCPTSTGFPISAETSHAHLFWDICPDSPNRSRDTPWQSHQSSQKQQGLPTSDTADAFDITRDGNQHSFYQVIILCICAAEVYRCYAPIKRVVPLFHSIITPVKTRSRQGRSTSIHPTGNTARWGAYRPAMSGVPLSVMAQAREDQSAQQTMNPIRLTPSDHSGCTLGSTPDPSVDSQGWYRE